MADLNFRMFRERSFISTKSHSIEHNNLAADLERYKNNITIRRMLPDGTIVRSQTLQEWLDSSNFTAKSITKENLDEVLRQAIINDDDFVLFAKQFLHQGAIPWALLTATQDELRSRAPGEGLDYALSYNAGDYQHTQTWSIYPDNTVLINENLTVSNITKTGMNWDDETGNQVFTNPSNEKAISATARHCIQKTGSHQWTSKNTDVAFEYHNTKFQKLIDKRSIISKIKDFFKALFGKNKLLPETTSIMRSRP